MTVTLNQKHKHRGKRTMTTPILLILILIKVTMAVPGANAYQDVPPACRNIYRAPRVHVRECHSINFVQSHTYDKLRANVSVSEST